MDLNQSLLPAVKEFIVEAIRNHQAGRDSFAIINAVTAVELVLKERLRIIQPTLMLRNIDAPDLDRGFTVGLSRLPQRLLNLGVSIEEMERDRIGRFAGWRNEIVHHLPTYDRQVAARQLPQLLDFIASFLKRELETDLKEVLPVALYSAAEKLLDEWQPILADARVRAGAEGELVDLRCPMCSVSAVLSTEGGNEVQCELCGAEGFVLDQCNQCGSSTVARTSTWNDDHYCDECIDRAGDLYMQQELDIRRGK